MSYTSRQVLVIGACMLAKSSDEKKPAISHLGLQLREFGGPWVVGFRV